MTPGDRYGHKKELATMGQPETLTGFLRLWETKKTQSQHHRVEANGGFDHILKLESLEEDFNALPFVTKHISIPKPQKKNYPHWSKLIDAEAGQLINDIYAKDFEYFGYEMLEF